MIWQPVVEAALEAMRPAAEAKAIRGRGRLDRALGISWRGDCDRLQQVVWNLLTNAVKFTPNQGRVEVSVRREGRAVSIVVADTETALAPDLLRYVLVPFRGGQLATRAHGGLGLGLALVRQLVELHGGRVLAESPGEGKGSTFTVALPFAGPRPEAEGQAGELSEAVFGGRRAAFQGCV